MTRTTCERVESNAATGECEVCMFMGEMYVCDVCVFVCGFYIEFLVCECGLLMDDVSVDFGDVKIARRIVLFVEVFEFEVFGVFVMMFMIKYEVF